MPCLFNWVYNNYMYELYPYFTNDGSVGLYSAQSDDIYHSTYGALSESWQKFIIPSKLEEYIKSHDEVKILDICYGIGYNTKTALQVFINNFLENNNNLSKINNKNIQHNEAIYTDNISSCVSNKKILIDAVDTDKTLMSLSPFISTGIKHKYFYNKYIVDKYFEQNNKLLKIKKISKLKFKFCSKSFRLKNETQIILLMKLFENNPEFLNDIILQSILNYKNYFKYISPNMINFAKFYHIYRYKTNKSQNKLAFLHNIYYKYISKSYKNAQKIVNNNNIYINLHTDDARNYIRTSDTKYNYIFLDAFTPAKCPNLWTVQFFKELFNKLDDDGMILTYSNSAAVRNAFLQCGFAVGKTYDKVQQKFVGTVAVKNKNLIEYNLDEKDWGLINSKAGICYEDEYLNLDNSAIINNRNLQFENSNLISSSRALKGYTNDIAKQI